MFVHLILFVIKIDQFSQYLVNSCLAAYSLVSVNLKIFLALSVVICLCMIGVEGCSICTFQDWVQCGCLLSVFLMDFGPV